MKMKRSIHSSSSESKRFGDCDAPRPYHRSEWESFLSGTGPAMQRTPVRPTDSSQLVEGDPAAFTWDSGPPGGAAASGDRRPTRPRGAFASELLIFNSEDPAVADHKQRRGDATDGGGEPVLGEAPWSIAKPQGSDRTPVPDYSYVPGTN